jgi:hypothetical protein
MKIKISLAAAGLLVGPALFADSTSIANALKIGSFGGEFSVYGQQTDPKHGSDNGYGVGSFNMFYSTDSFYGFKLSAGSRANHAFWEVHSGNYKNGETDKAILHTANIAYSHEYFDAILGRQEINLNWMSDFHEALVGVLKVAPDTAIILGYSQRAAAADFDAPLAPFAKLGEKGAFVADVQWKGVEGLVVNPFVYYASKVAKWGGAKVDYDLEISDFAVGGTAQYTLSKENSGEDGSFLQVEARGGFKGLNAKLGYFKTDKKGGAGSITAAGDNVNPFEDGDQIFEVDARTFYLGASYEIANFTLSALYGDTKFAGDEKFKELDLGVGYQLSEKLALQGFLINGNGNGSYDDYTTIKLGASYSF